MSHQLKGMSFLKSIARFRAIADLGRHKSAKPTIATTFRSIKREDKFVVRLSYLKSLVLPKISIEQDLLPWLNALLPRE